MGSRPHILLPIAQASVMFFSIQHSDASPGSRSGGNFELVSARVAELLSSRSWVQIFRNDPTAHGHLLGPNTLDLRSAEYSEPY